jgi:hypothetical protein
MKEVQQGTQIACGRDDAILVVNKTLLLVGTIGTPTELPGINLCILVLVPPVLVAHAMLDTPLTAQRGHMPGSARLEIWSL